MTLQEIAIFKRFIGQHELRKNFIKKYRKSIGLTRNPESVEQYLSNVEPEKVITSAVKHFIINEAMGFDFWQSVNESWLAYLKKMRSSHTIEQVEAETMQGYYAALRENWDKEKSWIYDPIVVAKVRYGLITPEEAGLMEDEESQPEPVAEDVPEEKSDDLINFADDDSDDLEIDFVEIDKTSRIANRLRSGIISVNTRNYSHKIGINRIDTKTIRQKQVKNAMVGKVKSGDVVIQFNNNSKGVQMVYTSDNYYNINSRQFVENLRRMMDITDDLAYLRIEKIAEKMDSITYKVTKQQ